MTMRELLLKGAIKTLYNVRDYIYGTYSGGFHSQLSIRDAGLILDARIADLEEELKGVCTQCQSKSLVL